MKEVIRLEARLRQGVANVGLLVVINLATDMISGTAYIDKNVKILNQKKDTL